MTGLEIGIIALIALLVLLALRMPVGTAMLLIGIFGILAIRPAAALPIVAGEIFSEATSYALTVLPMFILMGSLAGLSGMSRDLFDAANAWVGHKKGGLASATILGCAAFSALSGSSLAAALTMGRVSLPQMQRFNYNDGLASGSVAAGGTLGILIPPSAGFVVYAILTEVSIGQLFLAGLIPGILLTILFIITIRICVGLNPDLAPQDTARVGLTERLHATGRASTIFGIIVAAIGGIYLGVFSAIEAAGIGAALALFVSAARRALSWAKLEKATEQTLTACGAIFYILFGAFVFKTFIAFTGIPFALSGIVEASGLATWQIILIILLGLIILGTVLDGFAILVLTVPMLQPILESQGVDLIWFGVLMVITLEMALISPPVGMNVFVVKSLLPKTSLGTVFRGIFPFWLAMAVAIALVLLFPQIALWMPGTMF